MGGGSSPSTPTHGAPAPWRDLFIEHLNTMSQPLCTFTTLHPVPASEASTAAIPVVPRARTVMFRGLWGTGVPDDERNPATRNPRTWDSDMPFFTTDARMDKASEILDTAATPAAAIAGQGPASGGGGAVEAVWWCASKGTQWRLRGTAYVVGPDVEGEGGDGVRRALLARMRRVDGKGESPSVKETDWSWKTELTAVFGSMSPSGRGMFRHPSPGTPRAIPAAPGEGLGQNVEDLDDEIARAHFRVVVVVPTEVDHVDLSDPNDHRRWQYTYRGSSYQSTQPGGEMLGEWEKIELWP